MWRRLGYRINDRLNHLNVFTLERGWARGELIQILIMLSRSSRNSVDKFFATRSEGNQRGHHFIFLKPQTRTSLCASSFKIQVVRPWNTLPVKVVPSLSLTVFKYVFNGALTSIDNRWFPRWLHFEWFALCLRWMFSRFSLFFCLYPSNSVFFSKILNWISHFLRTWVLHVNIFASISYPRAR